MGCFESKEAPHTLPPVSPYRAEGSSVLLRAGEAVGGAAASHLYALIVRLERKAGVEVGAAPSEALGVPTEDDVAELESLASRLEALAARGGPSPVAVEGIALHMAPSTTSPPPSPPPSPPAQRLQRGSAGRPHGSPDLWAAMPQTQTLQPQAGRPRPKCDVVLLGGPSGPHRSGLLTLARDMTHAD